MDFYTSKSSSLKLALTPVALVLTSFYLFPFEFSFAVGYNTKMVMAGVGLILLCFQMASRRSAMIDMDLVNVIMWAGIVSLCGVLSVLYNNTTDFAYGSYIVSMAVWLSAANVVVSFIRYIHGYVSVRLVCKYLIAVCVMQCVAALLINNFDSVRIVVNTYVSRFASTVSSGNSLTEAGRLYGIGAALDVAGSRFSPVLIMIAYCIIRGTSNMRQMLGFFLCFIFIVIVGCSISRTTLVGAFLAFLYWILAARDLFKADSRFRKFFMVAMSSLIVAIPVIIYLYNTNGSFHNSFRFAFEGFFNFFETGSWETGSTDILKTMYKFPEDIKTWIIGDGYFADPIKTDPYYTGVSLSAFYMGIDVGYLRFIYYFGLLGLIAFIIYFLKVTNVCISCFPVYRLMFILIVAVNFIVWLKVSTDIFLVFALFLCISKEDNDAYEERMLREAENGALPVAEE